MGMYLKHRHFIGAYKNGRHVNGYFYNNHELFHYKTNLYITYHNPVSGHDVVTQKAKLDWNTWYDFSNLPVNIPNGYSDQAKYLLSGQTADLGLQSVSDNITRVYMTWNVIPVTGLIYVQYKTTDDTPLLTKLTNGTIGSSFNISTYETTDLPTNFTFDSVESGDDVSQYQSNDQTVIIRLKYQPASSTVTINFSYNDSSVGQTTATGNVGDVFNITQYLNQIPSGYGYEGIENNLDEFPSTPQTVTIDVQPASSSNINIPTNPTTSQHGLITINYVDQNGNTVSSQQSQGIPGEIFDIEPYEIAVPNGYTFYETLNGDDISTYPQDTATITIEIIANNTIPQPFPTPDQPVPNPAPQPANVQVYRQFYDENLDSSNNPNSYNINYSKRKQEGKPQGNDNIIYTDDTPISVRSTSLKFSDLGLDGNSTILGPNEYYAPYLGSKSYYNLYIYRPDTTQSLGTETTPDGSTIITIPCVPAFVKGVTFQYVIPNSMGGVSKHIVDAPSKNATTPSDWSTGTDPYTNTRFYIIPYGYKISEQELTKELLGGKKNHFIAHSNKYTLENNRKITIKTPYDFMLYCRG